MVDFVATSKAPRATHTKPALINYVAAIFAAIGSFLFGYDSGIISSVIAPSFDQFHDYFHQPGPNVLGAVVSAFAGGAFFGALLAGSTADKYGRKRTIQMGSVFAIVGCAIQTGAVHIAMLILGRVIAGISIGILSMIVPVYQAEISPPHARGLLSGWTQLMIIWGFFFAGWIGYGCQFLKNSGQWRIPLAIQIMPAILLLLGMFLLPYSPRWLAKQGRYEESKATLLRLHGGRSNAKVEIVEAEFEEMLEQIKWEEENLISSYSELISNKANIHRTMCGLIVQAMSQWTGVNVNNYFGPTIYAGLGFTGNKILLINGISGVWQLIVTWIFITFIVDRIGRRLPLIIGPIFMSIFLAWQAGIASKFADPTYTNQSMGIAGLASIFSFSAAFSASFGPVSWIYQSEIFPMNQRAYGTAASTASNWLNNVIIGQVTPYGFDKLGWKYFFVFVATNATNAVVSYFLCPETKNLTLEEIGLLFGDKNVRSYEGESHAAPAVGTEDLGEKEKGSTEHIQHATPY